MRLNVKALFVSTLLFLLGFFSSWGKGLQQSTSFDVSKISVFLMIITISIWVINFRCKIIFPKYFNLFILFLCLHTFITYFFFCRDEFFFGHGQDVALDFGYYNIVEPKGNIISRYILFILFSYSLAGLLYQTGRIFPLLIGNALGVICVSGMGGYHMYYSSFDQMRISGGTLDPNDFGLSGVTAFFFIVMCMSMVRNNFFMRIFLYILLFLIILIIYSTGSRGAVIGLVVGLVVFLYQVLNNLRNRIQLFSWLLAFLIIVAVFLPKYEIVSINDRMSFSQMVQDRGTMRMDIWHTYLSEFSKYALTGVGLERSNEEIVTSELGGAYVTHDVYLQVLVEFGLLGVVLFIFSIIQLWKFVSVQNKFFFSNISSASILALFSGWIVVSLFLNTFQIRETWLIFAVIAAFSFRQKNPVKV